MSDAQVIEILAGAFESVVVDKIAENAQNFAPPICVDGLNLNGVLDFNADESKLFGIRTQPIAPFGGLPAGYGDYLGITVEVVSPSP